jgi:dihydrofolate reductase
VQALVAASPPGTQFLSDEAAPPKHSLSAQIRGCGVDRIIGHYGINSALNQAREAAVGRDVKIGGGVATIRQHLQAGLIDELHLALSPVLLGEGEHL